jgi:hypothetical protein
MNEKIEYLFKTLLQASEKNFERDGELSPIVIFILKSFDIKIMPAYFSNQEEKELLTRYIAKTSKELGCIGVYMAFESWSVVADTKEQMDEIIKFKEENGSLKDCKGVKEIISITLETITERKLVTFDIDRENRKLFNKHETSQATGLFFNVIQSFNYN